MSFWVGGLGGYLFIVRKIDLSISKGKFTHRRHSSIMTADAITRINDLDTRTFVIRLSSCPHRVIKVHVKRRITNVMG